MKTKKHTLQISICLMCISFIGLIILQFRLYPISFRYQFYKLLHDNVGSLKELLVIIFGGVFTSSFVVMIIGIGEYRDEKRKALENYYNKSSAFLQNLKNIDYFDLRHPKDLVQKCFMEETSNKVKKDLNKQIDNIASQSHNNVKASHEKLEYKEKSKLKQCIWNELDESTKQIFKGADAKNKYLDMEYNDVMKEYHKNLDIIMKQYIDIKNLTYDEVENAYGQLDFFKGNKKIRNAFIFEKLHKKQRDVWHFIIQEAWLFEQYSANNGNIPVMIDKILEIQDKIFCRTENKMGYTIFNHFRYDIDTELYNLLRYTYGKNYKGIVPDKKTYAVFSKVIFTDEG